MKKALCVMFLTGISFVGQAQPMQVLLLPLETTGSYEPMDDDQMGQKLSTRLQQLAPQAQFQTARAADLTAYSYNASGDAPPSPEQAQSMGRAYQANYICWTDIHFQPSYDQGMLALAGAARVWIYRCDQHKVVMDQPLSLIRTGKVANIKNSQACQKVAASLAEGCVNDLAVQLVAVAQQRTQEARNAVPSQPPPSNFQGSADYQSMLKAIAEYQRGGTSEDYITVNESEQQMSKLWMRLNKAEQDRIEQAYPSIARMMNSPPIYGGGYWPYYYSPRPYSPRSYPIYRR